MSGGFTVTTAVCLQNLLSSVFIEKSGSLKIQAYNASERVICLPAKMAAVRIFGVKIVTLKRMPNETVKCYGEIIQDGNKKKRVSGRTEAEVKHSLQELFPEVFDHTEHKITSAMKTLEIKTHELPRFQRPLVGGQQCTYRVDNMVRSEDIRKKLDEYRTLGYIERVAPNEPMSLSPMMPFMKAGKNEIRVVHDFRELNGYFSTDGRTQIDVRRVVEQIPANWKYFSTVDLKDGFFSVPIEPTLRQLFGFQYEHRRWVYRRLPQGFSFSPILFAERIAHIIENTGAINFADDLILGGETPEEHHERLTQVFKRLRKFGLKVNLDKMRTFRREITYLRYQLKEGRWSLDEYLAEKWKQIGKTTTRKELEKHIGILSFARTHVPNVEVILRPLRQWLKRVKSEEVGEGTWKIINLAVRRAYESSLSDQVALSRVSDSFDGFVLYTDWTDWHIGYMLFGECRNGAGLELVDLGSLTMKEMTSSYLGECQERVSVLLRTRSIVNFAQSKTLRFQENFTI